MMLEEGRIRIYLADVRPLYEETLQRKVYEKLPEVRQKKADACKMLSARAASLAVGFLAEYAVRQEELSYEEIFYEAGGRPVVKRRKGQQPLYISLSHSGDYAVCALCRQPVGVDIQQGKKIRTGMLRHFMTPKEAAEFCRYYEIDSKSYLLDDVREKNAPCSDGIQPERGFLSREATEAFFRDWTAKESYMKLTGKGMSLGFSNLTVDWKNRRISEKTADNKSARLFWVQAPEGYFMTACAGEAPQTSRN
ncbi:MAG: 4'-phosphopantetheinyl transferase superfamily protein [Lachnospiraceae bacterium]|nr:4'-phosphopantetheinyl transferase superfamily protein [Lachnospiraceae bacterium]